MGRGASVRLWGRMGGGVSNKWHITETQTLKLYQC